MSTSPASEYVPDPDRDSAYLVDQFLVRLGDELDALPVPAPLRREIVDRVRDRQHALYAAGSADLPDEPARYNRRYTTAVLAAYRVLTAAAADEPNVPTGPPLLSMLTRAFVEPLAAAVAAGTRALLDAAADPFATMVAVARAREREDFGAEFVFVHPADDGERFFADVHRCGYHEYLRAQGAPELTPVLCAFDANWISAIDPHRHGFAFTRTTTIGTGGPFCPFHFHRTGPHTDTA
jgi:hypothetical protein